MADPADTRALLADLVAFPTVSSRSNLDLIDHVAAHLDRLGVPSTRIPDPSGEKASLIALIGPSVPGGVVLSGHTDVVPVEGQDWSSDPFTLAERGGRLFGRGTCDMKGFCATALALVPEMLAAGLKRPVVLAFSYDEEVGCLGAPPMIAAMLAALPPPQAVIVGEPSEMRVVTGHKGSWDFAAQLRGHEVHSSMVHRGVSAISAAARFIQWMDAQMAGNARAAGESPFEPPYTTLHAGTIHGGTAKNITARDCRFLGEIRVMPDESTAAWRQRVDQQAALIAADMRRIEPATGIEITSIAEIPQLRPEDGGAAETLARRLTGDNGVHVVSYQTEAGQFQDAGLSTVVCGPGSIEQAHKPDEFISLDQLAAGAAFMRRLIRDLAA